MRVFTAAVTVAALTIALLGRTDASPTPTPVPGGANQAAGTSGPITGQLFNGKLRLSKMSLTPKTDLGDNFLVFSTIVANGTKKDREVLLEAHLADADGVTLNQSPGDPEGGPCALAPGAACRNSFRFKITDPQFKPVKVLVEELGNGPQPVFRVILVPPSSQG
jgi:hypothetical protein